MSMELQINPFNLKGWGNIKTSTITTVKVDNTTRKREEKGCKN